MMQELKGKLLAGTAVIGLVGLGYVGLPLAVNFSKHYRVIGYDTNEHLIRGLLDGKSAIADVKDEDLKRCIDSTFTPTADHRQLARCDVIIICVPTPLFEDDNPDLSYIKSALSTILQILRKGQLIVLESTTYPGTTDDVVIPMLESSGLIAGIDFGVAYSPERIDPGNRNFSLREIPKVVSGINEGYTDIALRLYGRIFEHVVPVSNTKTAEAVKMLENIFRNVNIALVNEMSIIFEKMGINTWEVISAASTKPFGFMPFYPGPGVGGHCIPLDPLYLSYKAKKFDIIPRFIDISSEINDYMKIYTINLAERGLKKAGKKLYGANISIIGLAYKKNINDTRESPAIRIIEELCNMGASVRVYDPFVTFIKTKAGTFRSANHIDDALKGSDCAIFTVDHDIFRELKLEKIGDLMDTRVIIDCKNIFQDNSHVIYLGIGKPEAEHDIINHLIMRSDVRDKRVQLER